ncbi:MAG: HYC_CC_PP family protein [Flavobacterium sp.]
MQLRKSISLLLAFFLLVSSSGWSLNIHYCGGEIASVTAFEKEESNCCGHHSEKEICCSTEQHEQEEHDECCSDDLLQVELEDTVLSFFDFDFFDTLPYHGPSFMNIEGEDSFPSYLYYYCESNAPPLYLLYSQLVLYA